MREPPNSAAVKRRCDRAFACFHRNESGASAVEFGFIVVPFLALLLAVVQAGFYFMASEGLDVAVQGAARNIYTGTAQGAGIATASAFSSTYLCPANAPRMLPSFIDCSKLIIDVRTTTNFTGADTAPDFYKTTTQFCPGAPGDIVIVRVIYPLPSIVPILFGATTRTIGVLHTGMVNDVPGNSGWKQLLLGTAVFQNEPYDGSTYSAPTGC